MPKNDSRSSPEFDLNLTIMHIAEEIFGIFILAPWRDCVIVNISVQFCNNGFKKGIILEYDPTGFVLTHIERELDVSVFFGCASETKYLNGRGGLQASFEKNSCF